jgi:cobalamin biosynthesis protein CobW
VSERVPVLVVSGFLGSGKTTLVRHLLAEAQRSGVRVAVISNEFGELGIDQSLLGGATGAYAELAGGCVCCQLSDELVVTLQMLRERVQPQRVVIETSGVALPYDTQLNFEREPVRGWIGDDAAVVVVNAEQLDAGRDLAGTFVDQVSSADLLLLNKLDLVPADRIAELERRLGEWAPGTPVLRAVHGRVDPALLFTPDLDEVRPARSAGPHRHEAFRAEEREVPAGVSAEELVAELRDAGALRVKGFVVTSEGLRLVQGVGPRIELSPVDEPPPAEQIGRLVVIRRAD